jgi:hypothetical protein
LTAILFLHPLVGGGAAWTSCTVNIISIATTATNPSAVTRTKITNVKLVSIGSKYLTKYIILIGDFEKNLLFMGLLYISLSFFGNPVIDSQKSFSD